MSDERKYLRLLRLGDAHRARSSEQTPPRSETPPDPELRALLSSWEAPDTPAALDRRLLASFRAEQPGVVRPPLWRRALTSSVRIPLPVAGLCAVALITTSAVLALRPSRITLESTPLAPPPAATRLVEVPVVRERVVTRTVFVGKKERAARGKQRQGVITANATDAAENSEERAGEQTGYFTRVNMTEFQPAGEMKIRVIKGNRRNEK